MKMNNKGQTLVLFILLLPFLILLLGAGIDLGSKSIQKRKTDKVISYVTKYGINHLNDEDIKRKMENLINENLDNVNSINIQIKEEIEVEVTITFKTIFENIILNDVRTYKVKYRGYLENNKIKIVRG